MNLDRRLLNQIGETKAALFLAVLAGFLSGIAVVLQARQLSQILNGVFLSAKTLSDVTPWLKMLLGIVVLRAVLTLVGEVSANAAAQQVKENLRNLLARQLLALGPAYTQGERSGELVNTVTQGIEALDAYFSQYLPQLALAGLLPLAYLAIIIPLDPLSGLILLLTGPLIPFFMFLIGSVSQKLTQRQWVVLGRMSAYFLDTLQGLATLKTLGRSRDQTARIAQVSDQYREATMGVLRVTFLSALVLELLGTIGTAIIAVEIGLRLLYGRIGFESAFFILLLAPEFYLPLRTLGLRFHASMSGVSAARRIFEVLEQPLEDETAALAPAEMLQNGVGVLSKPISIDFENVSYTYPGRDQAALTGVSMRIRAGQTVALVGASGAGKSTIAGLLLRFIQPAAGCIRVNGFPLNQITVEEWRAQIAWVPQQPYLFHGTIGDNLRLAKPGAPDSELRRAAAQAYLLEAIDLFPKGLDTPVGEGGAQLSGGQAQRLALARAFLRDAPVLVLDEPTAHLDVVQERLLQETTRRLCLGRTVLVIAHRLPTVAQADQIIVLDEGRVVECGQHTDLLAQGGRYTQMLSAYRGGAL